MIIIPTGRLLKPKAIRNMVEISRFDKKIWEDYVSNLEKHVLLPQNKGLLYTKRNNNKISFKYNDALGSVKNLKKKKLEPNMILDLHGHTLYSSKLLLHKFIPNCYEKNIRNILIVTGKGKMNKGKLKEEVPKWLNEIYLNKYLVSVNLAPNHFGGNGALLVRLKNRSKNLYK